MDSSKARLVRQIIGISLGLGAFTLLASPIPKKTPPPKSVVGKKLKHRKDPALAGAPGAKATPIPGKGLPPRAKATDTAPNTAAGSNGVAATTTEAPTLTSGNAAAAQALLNAGGDPKIGPCSTSLDEFLRLPSVSQIHTGPGDEVFYLSNKPGVSQLFATKSLAVGATQLTTLPEGVRSYEPSADGKTFLLTSDVGGDEQYDLYFFDRVANVVKPVWVDRTKRIESFRWSPSGTFALLTANGRSPSDMDLYRWDVGAPKPVPIAQFSGMFHVADVASNGTYAILEDVRSNFDSRLVLWNLPEKRMMPLPAAKEPSRNESARFATNDAFWFLSDRDGDFMALYRQPILGGAPTRLLSEKADVEQFALNADRSMLVAEINADGYSQLRVLATKPNGEVSRSLGAPSGEPVVATSIAIGEGAEPSIFATASSSDLPPTIVRWQGTQHWQLTGTTVFATECRNRATAVRYTSFDGREIPAFVFESSVGKPGPYVLLLHGGPEAQFRPEFQRTVQFLTSRGYGVFAPNFRGSTGYGKAFAGLDDYRKRMDAVQDAVFAAHWLTKSGRSAPKRIVPYGGSYGGFLVLRTMQVAPELFGGGAESVGIVDFVEFLKGTKSYRRALREREYGPMTDTVFLRSISPITFVDRFAAPLLLFHGARDPRVPVAETERLAEALRKAGKPFETKIFSNAGHGHAKVELLVEQTKILFDFLEKSVGEIARKEAARGAASFPE